MLFTYLHNNWKAIFKRVIISETVHENTRVILLYLGIFLNATVFFIDVMPFSLHFDFLMFMT